jgi:hypothetical protein
VPSCVLSIEKKPTVATMSCPNGSSLPTTLITSGLCVDDNTQLVTYWVWTILSALMTTALFFLMIHTILYGRIIKNRIIIFGTLSSGFLFFMDVAYLNGLGFIVTTDTLNIFAIFMIPCMLIVVEKWALVPTHLISRSDSNNIRKLIHVSFNTFNSVWWIPMIILWSFGNAHGQDNILLAAGLMVAGMASIIASMIVFYVFRRIKYFIEMAIANAPESSNSKSELPKALLKINRYIFGVLFFNVPGGCICLIAAAIIIHDGTIYIFYYIFFYAIHPFAWGLFLPVLYVHLTTAKKTKMDSQHTSSSFDEPLYPGWGICGSPVHDEEAGSRTSSIEHQVSISVLTPFEVNSITPAMQMLRITK